MVIADLKFKARYNTHGIKKALVEFDNGYTVVVSITYVPAWFRLARRCLYSLNVGLLNSGTLERVTHRNLGETTANSILKCVEKLPRLNLKTTQERLEEATVLSDFTAGNEYLVITRLMGATSGVYKTEVFRHLPRLFQGPLAPLEPAKTCITCIEARINHRDLVKKYDLKTKGMDNGY